MKTHCPSCGFPKSGPHAILCPEVMGEPRRPAAIKCQEWLRAQPRQVVENILGQHRAHLFIDHLLPLGGLVDEGQNKCDLKFVDNVPNFYGEPMKEPRNRFRIVHYESRTSLEFLHGDPCEWITIPVDRITRVVSMQDNESLISANLIGHVEVEDRREPESEAKRESRVQAQSLYKAALSLHRDAVIEEARKLFVEDVEHS